jgi:NADP-reducing hydrogenase subunit HndB
MKSLAELAAIREKMQDKVLIREQHGNFRIVVGMATCGITAGARPVLNEIVEQISKEGLTEKATVVQTGCIGLCQYEPVVEIFNGEEKVTYVKVTPEKVARIINEHIKNGKVVSEFTIGAETK